MRFACIDYIEMVGYQAANKDRQSRRRNQTVLANMLAHRQIWRWVALEELRSRELGDHWDRNWTVLIKMMHDGVSIFVILLEQHDDGLFY